MNRRALFALDEFETEIIEIGLRELSRAANLQPPPTHETLAELVRNSPLARIDEALRFQLRKFETEHGINVDADFKSVSDLLHWRGYIETRGDVRLSFLFESLADVVGWMASPECIDEIEIGRVLNLVRALAMLIKPQVDGVTSQKENRRVVDKRDFQKLAVGLIEKSPGAYPTIESLLLAEELKRYTGYTHAILRDWAAEIHPNRGRRGRPKK